MDDTKDDFFLFGATSEIAQALFRNERAWLQARVRRLILVQRGEAVSDAYDGFDRVVLRADAGEARQFRRELDAIVAAHATRARRMHVFPTYGSFHLKDGKKPHFTFTDEGFQINLNARLQIIDAFTPFADNTRFHLFGSLLGSFPYAGDYATCMWFVNQLPRHPAYAHLDLRVYNLGGMKTRFWDHAAGPANNPFVHDEIPTAWLREAMAGDRRGVFDNFPTLTARVGCTLGRMGVRAL
jgi:hypothetical protein